MRLFSLLLTVVSAFPTAAQLLEKLLIEFIKNCARSSQDNAQVEVKNRAVIR
jgi:hypothetical protein